MGWPYSKYDAWSITNIDETIINGKCRKRGSPKITWK